MNGNTEFILSAYATIGTAKAYCLHYGRGECEFLPKSQVYLEQKPFGIDNITPQVCYFRVPLWLIRRLRGAKFYHTHGVWR